MAETARDAIDAGVAGFSVEDFTGDPDDPIYELDLAAERVRAACEVAHGGGRHIVVTARAENYLHGRPDLADTIARLQAYQAAGRRRACSHRGSKIPTSSASCSAPSTFRSASWPGPTRPDVSELAELGVSRISVGGAFAVAAYGALVDAATELRDAGHLRLLGTDETGDCGRAGPPSVPEGDRHLDLDRAVAGQRRHADGRAGVTAGVTEDIGQHLARAVDHGGLLVEVGRRRHEAGDGEDPLDPVERSERLLEHGQRVEGADGGGLPPLLDA